MTFLTSCACNSNFFFPSLINNYQFTLFGRAFGIWLPRFHSGTVSPSSVILFFFSKRVLVAVRANAHRAVSVVGLTGCGSEISLRV